MSFCSFDLTMFNVLKLMLNEFNFTYLVRPWIRTSVARNKTRKKL